MISNASKAAVFCLLAARVTPAAAEEISFNRDIRPILTGNCTGCHGGVKEAGGVSFVFRDKALAVGESGNRTITPGHPELSELMRRVTSTDPDLVMPQPDHGPPLATGDVEKLRRWIEQGAEWEEHWAFEKPEAHEPPAVKNTAWSENDIDRFILARLEQEGLSPNAEAEPALLLRRLSIDLIGLPPTLEELDAFETAYRKNPDEAYGAAVDRLLASQHFGERWAAMWLDLARYADTEGLGLDRPRTGWPFRDWVIRAFNEGMPYDDFTLKQLAGDLLPDPTLDDLIATNFHRQTQANGEGGTDDEEFRVTAVMDRVATTWETWQGVTMGCVQCHSHPYDPIEHHEYYQSYAFFNNTRDWDLDQHHPMIRVPENPEMADDFARWTHERRKLLGEIHARHEQTRTATQWLPAGELAAESAQVKLEVADGGFRTTGNVRSDSIFDLRFTHGGPELSALRIELLPVDPETAIHTPEWGSVLSRVRLFIDGEETEIPIARVIGDEADPLFHPDDSLKDGGSGWGPYTKIDRPRSCVLVLEKPLGTPPGTKLRLRLEHRSIGGGSFPLVTRRGRIETSADTRWQLLAENPDHARQLARVAEINRALAKHAAASLPVMEKQPAAFERPSHLFIRGNWLEKEKTHQKPGIPALFGELPADAPADRLGFARWIVSKENPLAARVAVSRFWEQLFGTGLVETLEDFGSSGTTASHPELLDFLALRFRDHHRWGVKPLLREIVTSATYRQNSAASPELLERDQANRLLARGPRNRLSAESIRDHGLVASGLLSPELFGPPVFPPMPPGGWTPFKSGEKWATPDPGNPRRYRRAIYTYTKRSNPYPGFATFDAPPRDVCTKRRVLSNTPLQALEALNSPAHVEFSQGLARRMKYDISGTLEEKIAAGHRITTSRAPDAARLARLVSLFHELESGYREAPETMEDLADTPDGAAFTVLASVLLNLDEAVTK